MLGLLTGNALTLRVKAGDVDRMDLLFGRYQRPLFGFLYHMLGRAAGCDDLVHPPGKPDSLELSLVNGSVWVAGYSGKDVMVDAVTRVRQGDRRPASKAATNGMKRLSASNSLNLTAEGKNNHVEITTDSYQHPVDLAIKVPQKFSLRLSTVNNGDIFLRKAK